MECRPDTRPSVVAAGIPDPAAGTAADTRLWAAERRSEGRIAGCWHSCPAVGFAGRRSRSVGPHGVA